MKLVLVLFGQPLPPPPAQGFVVQHELGLHPPGCKFPLPRHQHRLGGHNPHRPAQRSRQRSRYYRLASANFG